MGLPMVFPKWVLWVWVQCWMLAKLQWTPADSVLWFSAGKICPTRNWTHDLQDSYHVTYQCTWPLCHMCLKVKCTIYVMITCCLKYIKGGVFAAYRMWLKIKVLYNTRCVFWGESKSGGPKLVSFLIILQNIEMLMWCLFCDQSDHIWQYQQMCECYICSGSVFWCEFNGDVHFVIMLTIYGNTDKYVGVIYVLEPFFMFCDRSDHIW
jgi:hypothetical protein